MLVNGIMWYIKFVSPEHYQLRRSDGSRTVGVTDYNTKTIYLNNLLYGEFLRRVLCHELVHVYCFSYNVELDIDTEEILADFISVYGTDIVNDLGTYLDSRYTDCYNEYV